MADSLKQILDKSQIGTPSTSIAPWKAGDIAVHDGQSISPQGTIIAAQIPNSVITSAMIVDGTIVDGDVATANKDGAAATPSMRTLGTAALTACAGNDVRLTEIGSATVTTSVTITSTSGGTSGTTVVALGNKTYNGSPVDFWFTCPNLQITSATVARRAFLWLCDETAGVGISAVAVIYVQVANVLNGVPVGVFRQYTPAAGVHNYSIRGNKDNAADTATVIAGSLATGYMPITMKAVYS